MFNIIFNDKRNEIVVTKQFYNAAKRFGSAEYNALKEAAKDRPTYKVVTRKPKAGKADRMKGLNYKFMKDYIRKYDEDASIMEEFLDLTAQSEEAKKLQKSPKGYLEVKEWFLKKHPEIKAFTTTQNNILETAKAASEKPSKVVSIQKAEEVVAIPA